MWISWLHCVFIGRTFKDLNELFFLLPAALLQYLWHKYPVSAGVEIISNHEVSCEFPPHRAKVRLGAQMKERIKYANLINLMYPVSAEEVREEQNPEYLWKNKTRHAQAKLS